MPKKKTRRPSISHFTDKKRCDKGHRYAEHGLVVKDGRLPSGGQKWRLECVLCRRAYNRHYFHLRSS